MAVKKILLRIVTPKSLKLEEEVDMVIMRCTTGDMGVLPNHEDRSAVLDYGLFRILNDGNERKMAVMGGFAEVQNNCITVLTSMAEWPQDIDREAVAVEHEEALKIHQEAKDEFEVQKAQTTIQRSKVLLEASSYILMDSGYHMKPEEK